ncbi:hypothetical protein SKAU_G00100150 [Synaphobranchus kaupii]|uniref:PiggyBac transposable element-derived protein domain-containing protein n=1 Tax=Synaphobranchus kaupii TaxID=118154 RepID=A0A9Q1FYM8_SYNKA|nr:hypothetical protein SKAU_G00100150 [Synaphobranchus kaupii]
MGEGKRTGQLALPPEESEDELVDSDEDNNVDMNLDESSDSSESESGTDTEPEAEPEGTDNNKQVPGGDKLFKVRPLLNFLNDSFSSIPMDEMLCVDEQMVPFKGRSQLKQYIPMKPKRWGYKFFILADQHGIVYNFDVYTGSIQPHPGFPDIGASGNIVLQLASAIPTNILHKLFFDNWFCSVDLQVLLEKEKIHSVGTVRQNRLAGCTFMDDGAMKAKGRGTHQEKMTTHNGVHLWAVKWFDNRPVTLLSTFVAAHPTTEVQRSKKWYHRIVFHMLDLTLVESWLLYRRDCQSQIPKNDQLPLLDFKIQVASCLCMENKVSNKRKGRPSQVVVMGKKKRGHHSFVPPDPVRRDNTDHWPLQASDKGRCKMPGCKDIVRSRCSKCAVFLCFTRERNCFFDYHKG